MRIGQGYDIHRFREDGEGTLRLGGVHVEGAPQLEGHSDGDALIPIRSPAPTPVAAMAMPGPSRRSRDAMEPSRRIMRP